MSPRSRSRSYSYSRSRSHSPQRNVSGRYRRSRSRSPSFRKKYPSYGERNTRNSSMVRDNPVPNKSVGIFGLSFHTTERTLENIFRMYGRIEDLRIVYDADGRSRGFGFVKYDSLEDAKYAKERCNGVELDGKVIRVDFSVTQKPHSPTPGVYMGFKNRPRRSYSYRNSSYDDYRHDYDDYDRRRPRY